MHVLVFLLVYAKSNSYLQKYLLPFNSKTNDTI